MKFKVGEVGKMMDFGRKLQQHCEKIDDCCDCVFGHNGSNICNTLEEFPLWVHASTLELGMDKLSEEQVNNMKEVFRNDANK